MQQVADWLEKLGVGVRGALCRERYRICVLRDLTDQDLKELGVSLGHRRKMLRAIAELTAVEKGAPKPAPPWPSRSPRKTPPNVAK